LGVQEETVTEIAVAAVEARVDVGVEEGGEAGVAVGEVVNCCSSLLRNVTGRFWGVARREGCKYACRL
jgi:hypothetical protein